MSTDPPRRAGSPSVHIGAATWLDPRRGFWLGVALIIVGSFGVVALVRGTNAVGGQDLAVSWPIWSLTYLLGLTVPLGAGFLAASIVAGRLAHPRRVEEIESADAEPSKLPPRLSARVTVMVGVMLIALATLDQSLHFVERVPPSGVERDILSLLVPLLGALAPLGTALIPAGWLLARLVEPSPVDGGFAETGGPAAAEN
ncbi:hypothetical protein L1277_002791 [Okibacterium sp. HSC-33S16]|uniref:hypothetical protein n=1 Tax=Okibacterium sp. HSC-33S16 TaxID=2910965 RepID=UPI00209FED24|nr:hypothetical protein [Okibacterium sp. HSC-33S16]MCP2032681.1 hypothetical protein [Okibacterium sp. HSC-33S16]